MVFFLPKLSDENQPSSRTIKISLGVGLVAGSLLALRVLHKKRAKAKRDAFLAPTQPQQGRPYDLPVVAPGKGAPLFTGLRVIDMSTHVAGPTVSRCMSELGAEVIKVEVPSGDLFRYTLVDFEKPRKFATIFETSNFGKLSVQLNLKDSKHVEQLLKLLQEADVLVTNTRPEALKRLGLDYDTVKQRFPHIIFAQVSAWGFDGPDAELAGYDVGAFFAASGVASITQSDGLYGTYIPAFGDITTGQCLLGGVSMALINRLKTGRGMFVNTTLLRNGMWCIAPHIVAAQDTEDAVLDGHVPDYSNRPLRSAYDSFYVSKDGKHFVLSSSGRDEDFEKRIKSAFQVSTTTELSKQDLQNIFSAIDFGTISFGLTQNMVDFSPVENIIDVAHFKSSADRAGFDSVYHDLAKASIGDCEGLTKAAKVPYAYTCSKDHGLKSRAPSKGAHTDLVLREGWSDIHERACLPKASKIEDSAEPVKLLSGFIVIELADPRINDVSVSASTCLMADQGALVIKVEPPNGCALRNENPKLFAQLNRGKRSVCLDLKSTAGRQVLFNLVADTDIVVTNLPTFDLRALNLDMEVLEEVYPDKILLRLRPFPAEDPRSNCLVDADGPLYAESGVAQILSGSAAETTPPPRYLFNMVVSQFVFTGAMNALFHKARTGEGQAVDMDYYHIGHWVSTIDHTWLDFNKELESFIVFDPELMQLDCPIPTFQAYKTKDGMWVQLLGLETKRHLPVVLKVLGIKGKTLLKVAWAVLTKVLPNRKEKDLLTKVKPVFNVLNHAIIDAIANLEWEVLHQLFREKGVWHCPVRRPGQLLSYDQAHAIGAFVHTAERTDELYVATPLEASTKVQHVTYQCKHVDQVPSVGDHSNMTVQQMLV